MEKRKIPISSKYINSSGINNFKNAIGIDIGVNIIKIAFLSIESNNLYFELISFKSKNLDLLNQMLMLENKDVKIYLTEGNFHKYIEKLKLDTNNIVIVPKIKAIYKGLECLLENNIGNFFLYENNKKKTVKTKGPCLVVYIGTGVSIIKTDVDGYTNIASLPIGGATFFGLAKLFIKDVEFKEIFELLERGKNENVDLGFSDVFSNQNNLKETELDNSILISLGKLSIDQKSDFRNDDILSSILHMILNNIIYICLNEYERTNSSSLVFTGYFCTEDCIIKKISEITNKLSNQKVNPIFISNSGFISSIGAIISGINGYNERNK
ncbi:pantothenate kinase [Hamiltosporidium tvaerminnensis]|uniref:Pantothenate kinase n=1 Tax=Hamiltosporidium tvaerminnensis TaxID=1176355 RepID=A0A4Q9M0A3_9MICR|nr:pantothenate kinase [Hamiltosporidium tvaerminnensis]